MTTPNSLRQLQRLSRPFKVLLSIALGLLVLFHLSVLGVLFFFREGGDWHAAFSFGSSGINMFIFANPGRSLDVMLESLTLSQRTMVALISIVCATGGGFVLFHLRQLFALYSRGVVFSADNIRHIKRFGLWLVIAAIAVSGSGHLFHSITGQHPRETANEAMAFIYGGMTYVVARVMELGRQADEERKEFV
jgi:Protein of unknown function (DUF2975)